MTRKSFTAVIREGRGGGAFVEFPFDVKSGFGSAQPKVRVTFDDETYRGKGIGDEVRVSVEADTEPREVTLPADVGAALRKARLEKAFDELSYTHRKEHIQAIEGAKRPETRARRIAKLLERCPPEAVPRGAPRFHEISFCGMIHLYSS